MDGYGKEYDAVYECFFFGVLGMGVSDGRLKALLVMKLWDGIELLD
jgi:hypothetical protein